MNYLAHAYLSFDDPKILIGNMIADYVKGKQILNFDEGVQRGITIHRMIDDFTDKNSIVKETKFIYRESAGRYDGSFLDITFDHFLALDSDQEPPQGWLKFTLDIYKLVDEYSNHLPKDFVSFYEYMKTENWLYNYRYKWLIEKNFGRFASHLKYLPNNAPVFEAFEENYNTLKDGYYEFFPKLKKFVKQIDL